MSFTTAVKTLFTKLKDFFISGKAQADFQLVENLAIQAAPYAAAATQIAAGFLPAPAGVVTLALLTAIQTKYPALFNGTLKTQDQKNDLTLGVATDLMQEAFPTASTTVIRAALHLALIGDPTAKAPAALVTPPVVAKAA